MAPLTIIEAKDIIFSQEDIPLTIKRSAWRLYRHEIERPDPNTGRAVSLRRALDKILGWMLIQSEKENRERFKISATQRKLLYLIVVEGFTQGQAAIHLKRSPDTVKQYCVNLRKQLGVDSFYQVIAIAVARGWVPPPDRSIT